MNKKIVIGKFGKTHGIKGWIRLYSFTDPIENILNYQPWQIRIDNVWRRIEISDSKILPKTIIVKIKDIEQPEQAKYYTNKEVAIERAQLQDLKQDEYYWSDLEGLTVVNKQKRILGKIDHLITTGSNDVMVIKNNREILVPYLNNVVLNVDLANGVIGVDWEED